MKNYPKVFVIVLNYNGKPIIKECLSSLFQMTYSNFEVVVVDNASSDNSFEQARMEFPQAHFIKNRDNLGFSAGNNVGIKFALERMADYVFLLNNDATVAKSTLDLLVDEAEKEDAKSILSPLIFREDSNDVWFKGGRIDWPNMQAMHTERYYVKDRPYLSEYVTGCAMFVPKEAFQKVGLFDEDYFLYYEDADFCVRAAKNGFASKVVPYVHVNHWEKSNTENPAKLYWLVLSGIIFFKKNSNFKNKVWLLFYLNARKVKNLIDVIMKKSEESYEVRRAYRDYRKVFK